MNRFNSVILDVDSTLSGIEGIDWLAARRGSDIQRQIAALTDKAMRGDITLDSIYKQRLELVRPTRHEIETLSEEYRAELAPGARACIEQLKQNSVQVVLISGGLREAILPLADAIGLNEAAVHAVPIFFTRNGGYSGFDESSKLSRQGGKLAIARGLDLKDPRLAVGDGMTDAEMKPVTAAFAAFTGFVEREPVIAKADFVIQDFRQLAKVVLG